MLNLFVLLSTSLLAQASAPTLSAEMEKAIMKALKVKQCDVASIDQLEVVNVSTRHKEIDQGQVDVFYRYTLNALEGDGDQRPYVRTKIVVDAAEYAISNPSVERIEILKIESDLCQ
jgi:hypothetical protein